MLRDRHLVPLSRQHQHALALCVRIRRALAGRSAADASRWESEVAGAFAAEISHHFAAEEQVLFPALHTLPALRPLVEELLSEHVRLRSQVAAAAEHRLGHKGLLELAETLSQHVRKEERRLFEPMQQHLPAPAMARLGADLERFFAARGLGSAACSLPP